MSVYFEYDDAQIEYLRRKDKRLGDAMEKIGRIERAVDGDVFSSVVHHIVGQQISTAAQATIWRRMNTALGAIDANRIGALSVERLQSFGITFKKAEYIKAFADKVNGGDLNLSELASMPDEQVVEALVKLPGVGVWTAEMLMIFCMQRKDVFSYGDLAIHRGLRMLHRHDKIDKKRFEMYRRRYSPCCTVASLYLWAIAGGALDGLSDPAAKKSPARRKHTATSQSIHIETV